MEDSDSKYGVDNVWSVDDFDVGLINGLSNLQGLGSNEMLENSSTPAYDMTKVLQLQLFKDDGGLESSDLLQSLNHSLEESLLSGSLVDHQPSDQSSLHQSIDISQVEEIEHRKFYTITMKAPTAPGRKLDEETLTWLNQGQSYEIIIFTSTGEGVNTPGKLSNAVIRLGFHERQHQYFECEKYEEWISNNPSEKIIDLDVPMCFGIHNVSHIGSYTNEIEFQFDPAVEAKLFVKVNCLSSDFMKNKSGSSGVPLRLQIEILEDGKTALTVACQIKVFRAKGANRKLKLEKEKLESSKKDSETMQPSCEVTIFNTVEPLLKRSTKTETPDNSWRSGVSPTSTQLGLLNLISNSGGKSPHCHKRDLQTLSANFDVNETQEWLVANRFQSFLSCFANFTGADLLRLTRSDLIQLCGPADGIRLNNAIQARASRPLLTMYVSPSWTESETGMREYHAMFLEQLSLYDLKAKLAKKCELDMEKIVAVMKQGPTGIRIHVDDDVVRNFADESHHVVEVIKDPCNGSLRVLLK